MVIKFANLTTISLTAASIFTGSREYPNMDVTVQKDIASWGDIKFRMNVIETHPKRKTPYIYPKESFPSVSNSSPPSSNANATGPDKSAS
mmetsp:Transcript_37790/g.43168  ORF Transcript_37790/g.43168 Transcript_37790/m.43168 type:complete len:90 (+) Transcript_37790:373-642(+)